jgi:hypothetical protein
LEQNTKNQPPITIEKKSKMDSWRAQADTIRQEKIFFIKDLRQECRA